MWDGDGNLSSNPGFNNNGYGVSRSLTSLS